MIDLPAFFIQAEAIKTDLAFSPNHCGYRKILVTELYPSEVEAEEVVWQTEQVSGKIPVQLTSNMELGYANQFAHQDRHFHRQATEIYSLVSGKMTIEVADEAYSLKAGDTLIVNPGTVHYVRPQTAPFLCQIIALNCGGITDKYVV